MVNCFSLFPESFKLARGAAPVMSGEGFEVGGEGFPFALFEQVVVLFDSG